MAGRATGHRRRRQRRLRHGSVHLLLHPHCRMDVAAGLRPWFKSCRECKSMCVRACVCGVGLCIKTLSALKTLSATAGVGCSAA